MTRIVLQLLILIALGSCKPKTAPVNQPAHESLQETKEISLGSGYRSHSPDLVNELYDDIVQTRPDLQSIEDRRKNVLSGKDDSLAAFQSYRQKIEEYYASATSHLSGVQDSLLRREMEAILANSSANSQNICGAHEKAIAELPGKEKKLADLYTCMKVVTTLTAINQFGREQLPSIEPIRKHGENLDSVTHLLDSMVHKTGR